MAGPVGIYVSVPFCKAKCSFCNFASGAFSADRIQPYVSRLCREIRDARCAAGRIGASLPTEADTVYFGGGTPSLLTAQQHGQIFEHLRGEFDLDPNAEITLECAPGQLADETLDELLRQGMNRISFGVQSFVDKESAAVGRLHTREQCEAEFARVRAAGLDEISIDLIVGLPHQTERSCKSSVEQAIASGVPHVSVYLLEVDDESRLGREMLEQGSRYGASSVPDEDEIARWYEWACAALDAAGVAQYEISNFARHGHRSRHNLKYWHRQPYIGFGLDAHSMLAAQIGSVRFANTSDLDQYLAGESAPGEDPFSLIKDRPHGTAKGEVITSEVAFEESLFLGLRLNDGMNLELVREQFGDTMVRQLMPALDEVRSAGLLEMDDERIRLTPQGRLLSNEVFTRLLVCRSSDLPGRHKNYSNSKERKNMMIDLRSDTVTRPTAAMREAMASAEVGDDVYGEDPTVNRLEREAAEVFGREAAIFVPTGTMGNQIAIRLHTQHGQEVICEARSHVLDWEMAMMAAFSGCQARAVAADRGILTWEHIHPAIGAKIYYRAQTGLITLENTHNMAGGTVTPLPVIEKIWAGARDAGLPVHLDGARVFNAAVALGVDVAKLTSGFDTVMFCLSKGLGAPVGSVLVGSREAIARARIHRKALGGGMRQAGILAAAGIIALHEMPKRLAEDHANARLLAEAVAAHPEVADVDLQAVQTNIVIFTLRNGGDAAAFTVALKQRCVLASAIGANSVRFVTHYDVDRNACQRAAATVAEQLKSL